MPLQILPIELSDGFMFDMVLVEGGTFNMGGSDAKAFDWEKPVHRVEIDSFYIGKYPVTQDLWQAIMSARNNPSDFQGNKRPVNNISWEDTQDFLLKLNNQTGQGFRLPTEAEWEYAARGGRYSQGYLYAGSDRLKQVGWYKQNSGKETKEVGLLLANELGLYDMSGNVYEWCEDVWHDSYNGAPADGSAWVDNSASHMFRGGCYFYESRYCRTSYRNINDPTFTYFNVGFRLALPFPPAI